MRISVVIPVCNEEENVRPLAAEIVAALADSEPFDGKTTEEGSAGGRRRVTSC